MITQKSKPSFDLLQGEANQVLIALNQLKEDAIKNNKYDISANLLQLIRFVQTEINSKSEIQFDNLLAKVQFELELGRMTLTKSDITFTKSGISKITRISHERGKMGLLSSDGEIIVEHKYDSLYKFSDGIAVVEEEYKYGLINESGKIILNIIYHQIHPISDGLSRIEIYESCENKRILKIGFVNTSGAIIIPCQYLSAYDFCYDVAIVKKKRWLLIDKLGSTVTEFNENIESIANFSESLAAVKFKLIEKSVNKGFGNSTNRRFGYVDTNGKIVIDCIYEEVEDFKDGIAIVKGYHERIRHYSYMNDSNFRVDAHYGVINNKGEEVISCDYYKIFRLKNFMIIEDIKGAIGVMNFNGKIIQPFQYRGYKIWKKLINSNDFIVVSGQNKSGSYKEGLINYELKIIIPFEHDEIIKLSGKLVIVRNGHGGGSYFPDGYQSSYSEGVTTYIDISRFLK